MRLPRSARAKCWCASRARRCAARISSCGTRAPSSPRATRFSGVVEQPGHRLHGWRCAVYIPLHCGHCAACRRGDTQMCLEVSSLIGWNRPGGYAEYVPVPENCLLPVPEDIEDRLAPLLLDTIGTSARRRALRRPGRCRRTRPPGTGDRRRPVGLGVVLALQTLGYRNIHISDPNDERSSHCPILRCRPHPVDDTCRRFPLIIECSGAHAARNRGINLCCPAARWSGRRERSAVDDQEDKVFRRKDFHMIRTFYFPIGGPRPEYRVAARA